MMETQTIINEFRTKVSDEIIVEPEGLNRFRIITPFTYGDGDHFVIFLKTVDKDRALLTDEGHTYMHLSYKDFDFWEGTRGKLLEQIKSEYQVNDNNGRLELAIPENRYGDALFSYIQAIQKITDIEFLTSERARSTFMEDFRKMLAGVLDDEKRLDFGYVDPKFDPEGLYRVDASYLNSRQYHFYGIYNNEKCKEATIFIQKFREWYPPKERPKPIGVCEDQTELSSRVLAWFTDVCHKTYSNLATARDDLRDYLIEEDAVFE